MWERENISSGTGARSWLIYEPFISLEWDGTDPFIPSDDVLKLETFCLEFPGCKPDIKWRLEPVLIIVSTYLTGFLLVYIYQIQPRSYLNSNIQPTGSEVAGKWEYFKCWYAVCNMVAMILRNKTHGEYETNTVFSLCKVGCEVSHAWLSMKCGTSMNTIFSMPSSYWSGLRWRRGINKKVDVVAIAFQIIQPRNGPHVRTLQNGIVLCYWFQ